MSNDRFVPNSFQVPNAVIDDLLLELSGAELKCYLFVIRKTKGWNKDFDTISISQFMAVTGLSNRKVIDACSHLVELGLLVQSVGYRGAKVYSANYEISTSEESSHVKKVHSTSEESSQDLVKKVHTQNTTIQNTTIQNKKTTQKKSNSALELLAEYNITGELAEEFIKFRKSKRATISKIVLNAYGREAARAGIPIQRAIEISIERGWQTFKADWNWHDGQLSTAKPAGGVDFDADDLIGETITVSAQAARGLGYGE